MWYLVFFIIGFIIGLYTEYAIVCKHVKRLTEIERKRTRVEQNQGTARRVGGSSREKEE